MDLVYFFQLRFALILGAFYYYSNFKCYFYMDTATNTTTTTTTSIYGLKHFIT